MERGRSSGGIVIPARDAAFRRGAFWTALRVVLGALFVGAALYKIGTPGAFAHQIYNYKILPGWAVNPLAIVLPWLQLVCGVGLVLNRFAAGASFWIAAMMIVFQAALASALMRGLNIACGCFETGGSPATWLTFGRDSLILVAALLVFGRCARDVRKIWS